ncbi:DeoR/GlpR family DNA-binding transcription regulator [Runella sp. MFBS21]|uniref:DeoR/GlpR family DNA-binding transcription regulator n=1 Tax=Runella sp. MFBS21 TaxID=3034018 RepID=UPI0023F63B3C|nr:DeoR/GlpR family DNA-binding transcription regulator [Runella sp. MFBS21]MDF7821677.1 DeoR/GlpR family DNA-binding transcription regulator [Runella sp. MFBS21]
MHQVQTHLLKRERQAFIMKQINLHNRVLSADLGLMLNVSEDTIRRDLNELAELGELVKVHGGALSKSYHYDYASNTTYALPEKTIIAQKAVTLIEEGMYVMVGGGTTVRELVRLLPQDLKATFFTVSLTTALQLCDHPSVEVIFLGGKLIKNSQISVGGEVISRVNDINADLCILGTNAIDVTEGITDSDLEAVQVKKAMMKASKRTAIVTISEKLGSMQRLRVCDLSDIDFLITELIPTDPVFSNYDQNGLIIL